MGAEILAEIPLPFEEDAVQDEEDLQSLIHRQLEEAIQWREEHLEPIQTLATEYYQAKPLGNEQEGRSAVVLTEVRDAVRAILPSLMRIFFGPEHVVEFRPEGPEDVEVAEQQTDAINYVVREENPGFLVMHSAFKDALVRRIGIFKWWWQEDYRVEESRHTGLTEQDIAVLTNNTDVDDVESVLVDEGQPEDPENGIMGRPALYDVTVRRTVKNGCAKIAAVPPEELVWSPNARSLADARMVAHVRDVYADDLAAMGVDKETIDTHAGKGSYWRNRQLEDARRPDEGSGRTDEDESDASGRPVRFAEVYARIDTDGDGIAELHKIQVIGDAAEIVSDEIVDEIPFAILCPDPEPHTIVGNSVADYTMDLQRINSAIVRGVMDSLSMSLNPMTEVVDGEVNVGDILNPEVGRIVRVRRPGMMREIVTPFVGREALPILGLTQEIKENRLGISKAAAGLDADALQSSTKAAVAATLGAAQQNIELMARIFAETGVKDLFKGLLRLVVRHQDRVKMIRLRNKWVPVDPSHWNANLDVQVNVALGGGMPEDKMQFLAMIAEKQEQNLLQGSPLVSLVEYRNTLGRMTELAGFKNSDEFWRPFGQEEAEAMAQAQAQQPPEPTESEIFREVEMAKIQARLQEQQADLQAKLEIARLNDQRERERIARDFTIRQAELQAKAAKTVTDSQLQAARIQIDADRADNDMVLGVADRLQGTDGSV